MTELMTVRCVCGWETTGIEADVVEATQAHGRRVHNMAATRDEVMAMAVPLEDPSAAPPSGPSTPAA